jgi:hypothetical protein
MTKSKAFKLMLLLWSYGHWRSVDSDLCAAEPYGGRKT